MKTRSLAACLILCFLTLMTIPVQTAKSQNYVQYQVTINSDGSAVWEITEFADVNGAVESWDAFQQKVFNIVDSASNAIHREMSVDEKSLMINTTISEQSKTIEYRFTWQNFSLSQENALVFGDVFQTSNFFAQLYGDAALQVNYPSDYSVKSVAPQPYTRDDAAKTFEWARTQDLSNEKTSVTLTEVSQTTENTNLTIAYVAILAFASLAIAGLVVFFLFKRRRDVTTASKLSASPLGFESEDEKIMKILSGAGGRMRQSDITEQTGFSKAKTSQLLTALEERGSITRYKSGRDKIVTLKERVKSE